MLSGMKKSSGLQAKFRAFHGVVGFVGEPYLGGFVQFGRLQ